MDPTIAIAIVTSMGSIAAAFLAYLATRRAETTRQSAEATKTQIEAARLRLDEWQALIDRYAAEVARVSAERDALRLRLEGKEHPP